MRKRSLFSFVIALVATVTYAQDAGRVNLEKVDGFYWNYDEANQTATIVSSYRWHSHGKKANGEDDMAEGCCHCYTGDIIVPEKAPNGYTVTGIGKECFLDCGITSIKMPNTLKFIDDLAFELCPNLKELRIPGSVERLGYDIFGGTDLEKFYIEDSDNPIIIGHVAVYGSFFMLKEALRYVYVGRNYTVENPNADETEGCKGLFYSCEKLEEVEFGSKVTQLQWGDCYGCKKLKKVTLSPNITTIPNDCFNYCESLVDCSLSSDLTAIKDYAFSHCPVLNLNLGGFTKLKTIGSGAFMDSQLEATKVVLPASVEYVGDAAFGFRPNLKEFYCNAVVPPTCESWAGPLSEEMYQSCKLFVPKGTVDAYKEAEGWKNFFGIEEMSETKCALPTITLENGKLKFTSTTAGVEFHYQVTLSGSKEGTGSEVEVPAKYVVNVYATKAGLEDSEVSTAELTGNAGGTVSAGDANNDGTINAADIVAIVNIIMGK